MIKRRSQTRIRVGDVLLHKGLITPAQLKAALMAQKSSSYKLGEILIMQGVISPQQVQQALREQSWRNVIATLVLSFSTLLPNLPRVLAQIPPVLHHQEDLDRAAIAEPNIGGGEIKAASPSSSPSAAIRYPGFVQSPVVGQTSVASPLQGFCHPLNGQGWLSQGNRGRTHQGRMEFAYDLATSIGTPVYSMRAGKVIAIQDKYPDTGGGKQNIYRFNYVWIEHDQGYRSIYVHLQQGFRRQVPIKAGDWVNAGQLIGYSGNSGWSSGPHLHIEVQQPSQQLTFSKTVPFAIARTCPTNKLAQNLR